jgi:hypothetical protein
MSFNPKRFYGALHARKRDDNGAQLIGVPACGARSRNTHSDESVLSSERACSRCLKILAEAKRA